MIVLDQVTFAYRDGAPVFKDFSWRAARGDVWAVLGPSGCGKSTLLLLLGGLVHPQSGKISVGGERLSRPRPGTGLILQSYGLLPWATVAENVALGLRVRRFYGPDGQHAPSGFKMDARELRERVGRWMARLGIDDVADRYPAQISGGQRQRTAIARTLVLEPDLLLMDEPFAALDAPTREDLQTLALDLAAEIGLTMVLVTHSIEEAAFVGQRVLVLASPPNTVPRVVPAAHIAGPAYRGTRAYREACTTLRAALALREA